MAQLLTRHERRLFNICARMLGGTGGGGAGVAGVAGSAGDVGPRAVNSERARQTAADLTQDALVKIVQGLSGFDGSSKVSTWMIRVAMNTVLSYLRSQKLRRHASLDAAAVTAAGKMPAESEQIDTDQPLSPVSREPSAASSVQGSEAQERLLDALASLDADQRAILVLRDVRGLDYDQIAVVLGVAVGTVKSRLFRAREALRGILEGRGF